MEVSRVKHNGVYASMYFFSYISEGKTTDISLPLFSNAKYFSQGFFNFFKPITDISPTTFKSENLVEEGISVALPSDHACQLYLLNSHFGSTISDSTADNKVLRTLPYFKLKKCTKKSFQKLKIIGRLYLEANGGIDIVIPLPFYKGSHYRRFLEDIQIFERFLGFG